MMYYNTTVYKALHRAFGKALFVMKVLYKMAYIQVANVLFYDDYMALFSRPTKDIS